MLIHTLSLMSFLPLSLTMTDAQDCGELYHTQPQRLLQQFNLPPRH